MAEKINFQQETQLNKSAVPVESFGEVHALAKQQEEYHRLLADYHTTYSQSPTIDLEIQTEDEESFTKLIEVLENGKMEEIFKLTANNGDGPSKVDRGVEAKAQQEMQEKIITLRDELREKFKTNEKQKKVYRDYLKQRQSNQKDLFFLQSAGGNS